MSDMSTERTAVIATNLSYLSLTDGGDGSILLHIDFETPQGVPFRTIMRLDHDRADQLGHALLHYADPPENV